MASLDKLDVRWAGEVTVYFEKQGTRELITTNNRAAIFQYSGQLSQDKRMISQGKLETKIKLALVIYL